MRQIAVFIRVEKDDGTFIAHELDVIPGLETAKALHRLKTGEEIDDETALELLVRDTPEEYD